MEKPPTLFGREAEWAALDGFAADAAPGTRLGVVRGRRRLGKSALVRALAERHGGFYHQALEGTASEQLRDLGRALGRHLGVGGPLDLPDWESALDVLLGSPALPRLVVLDELGYLLSSDGSLPSRLQRRLDEAAHRGRAVRLLVCGSALSVMSGLLVGSAPLRGRASLELPLRAFDHRDAAAFHGVTDPRGAVAAYSVVGGVPGYFADLLLGDVPEDGDDVDEWMVRGPLSAARPLLYEARHLLDDTGLRDRGPYVSALAAVAEGAGTNGAVAGRLRRERSSVAQTLDVLRDLELVRRGDDLLRPTRPTWRVADPLLRYWAVVMRPRWAQLEEGRAREVWADAAASWRSRVLGPTVEELARRWALTASDALGPVGRVGTVAVADRSGRTTHEIDVVGLDPRAPGTRVAVLGEAKAGRIGAGALDRLRRVRDLLVARGVADAGTKLLVVGLTGVDPALAKADGVVVVDGDRLYAGT